MHRLIPAMLIIAGLIHLVPIAGVLGESNLAQLYGVRIADPNLLILMRHRAVIFGLIGFLLLWAAFIPAYRSFAYIAGFVSVLSFLMLAWSVEAHNGEIGRVVTADLVATACLLIACTADYWPRAARPA